MPAGEQLLLQPGRTRLAFRATLLKRGLYTAQHLRLDLGALCVRMGACAPGAGGPRARPSAAVPLGEVDADGVLTGRAAASCAAPWQLDVESCNASYCLLSPELSCAPRMT